jgi:hypothetical protein
VTVAELVQKWGEAMPVLAFCGGVVWFAVRFSWKVSREVTVIKALLASHDKDIRELKAAKKGAA